MTNVVGINGLFLLLRLLDGLGNRELVESRCRNGIGHGEKSTLEADEGCGSVWTIPRSRIASRDRIGTKAQTPLS